MGLVVYCGELPSCLFIVYQIALVQLSNDKLGHYDNKLFFVIVNV